MTTLCRSQLYLSVRDYEFGYWAQELAVAVKDSKQRRKTCTQEFGFKKSLVGTGHNQLFFLVEQQTKLVFRPSTLSK